MFDPVAEAEAFPGAERVSQETGLRRVDPDATPYVVVATQGIWDEEALAVGVRAGPSRTWASSRRRRGRRRPGVAPRREGVPEERLAALRAPAGIDLGAETPEEVALSILAELVQVRRGRAPFVAAPGPGDPGRRWAGAAERLARARRRRHRAASTRSAG